MTWLAILGVIVVGWQLFVNTGWLNPSIFPSPAAIWRSASSAMAGGQLWSDLWATGSALLIGAFLGLIVGQILGLALALNRWFGMVYEWPLAVLNAVPRFALAPLVIISIGLGTMARSVLAFLGVVIPVALLVAATVRKISPTLQMSSHVYGLKGWRKLLKFYLPASLPGMFAGLQLGLTQALIAVIVAEMYNPRAGLGRWIALGSANLNPGQIWFASLLVGIVGALLLALVRAASKKAVPWPN